jgi:copper chaperone CopZ
MSTRTITIDGMKGDRCVQQVNDALNGLNGVEVKSVAVGSAVLECRDEAACTTACGAITGAGYSAHLADRGPAGSKPGQPQGNQPSGHAGSPSGTKPGFQPGSSSDTDMGNEKGTPAKPANAPARSTGAESKPFGGSTDTKRG